MPNLSPQEGIPHGTGRLGRARADNRSHGDPTLPTAEQWTSSVMFLSFPLDLRAPDEIASAAGSQLAASKPNQASGFPSAGATAACGERNGEQIKVLWAQGIRKAGRNEREVSEVTGRDSAEQGLMDGARRPAPGCYY